MGVYEATNGVVYMWRRDRGKPINYLASIVENDLRKSKTFLNRPQERGLADLVASLLLCRSANTNEIAELLPRSVRSAKEKYHYVYRWLSNNKIIVDSVMNCLANRMVEVLNSSSKIIDLCWIEAKIDSRFSMCLLGVKTLRGIVPINWIVRPQDQDLWQIQSDMLRAIDGLRLREGAVSITVKSLDNAVKIRNRLIKLGFNCSVIAGYGGETTEKKTLGIESIFHPINPEGIGIMKTQLRVADRIERLILVATLALYWRLTTNFDVGNPNALQKKKLHLRKLWVDE